MPIPLSRTIFAALVAALLSQGAAATWYTAGSFEPDNGFDDESFMQLDPPGVATDRIYFNVLTGTAPPAGGIFINPNVGMLETRSESPTLETHQAMLGVWVDCNGDGYIGTASGAMREYPSDLLFDTTICPPASGLVTRWTPGAHNYNGWVSEFVPIGDNSPLDRRTYADPGAIIWGDYGLPDTPAGGGGTCPVAPQPRGTYQSTGGFVNYVDCNTGLLETWNTPWQGTRLMGQNISGAHDFGVDDAGLAFDDDDNATGTWIDHPTFGSEDTADSPAYIYDCEADETRVGDVLNETPLGPIAPASVHDVSQPEIDPRSGNGQSVPALVNHTVEGGTQDCDTSNDAGHDFYGAKIYVGETDFNPVTGANKREANFNFGFGVRPRGWIVGPVVPVAPGGAAGFNFGPTYSGWGIGLVTLKVPATARVDIVEGTLGIPGAGYFTFYAHVTATTIGRGFVTPGGSGEYASGQCGENDSGIHNGWNCDPTTWYRNPDGTPVPEGSRPFARPGQVYELRDIDCHDGSGGRTGIGLGTPSYGESACPEP